MCYSTCASGPTALSVCSRLCLVANCSALLQVLLSPCTVLYDAFYSYLCRRHWNSILGPSSPPLTGESYDTCSKAVAFTLADTQVCFFLLVNLLYFQWGSLGPLRMVGKLNVYVLGCDEVILLDGFNFCNAISMRSTIGIM